jgi:hypothetical protein
MTVYRAGTIKRDRHLAPNFDKLEEKEKQRSFTSWKLNLLDAMSIDPRLKPFDFRLAFLMLQYMNGKTGKIFPSQETLAGLLNVSLDSVLRSIKHLKDTGWLTATRPNRQKSNHYAFETRNVNAMLDRRLSIEDAMREQRLSDPARLRPRERSDPARLRPPDPAPLLGEHLERNTSRLSGMEEEDLEVLSTGAGR